jgi:hypothetical protein
VIRRRVVDDREALVHARFKLTTRFETVQEFVVGFSACDGGSMFLKTERACVRGERCSVTIMLANKAPVLAGSWEVLEVFQSADNTFGARGIRVRIDELSPESQPVYAKLLLARAPRKTSQFPSVAMPRRVSTESGAVPRRMATASGVTPVRHRIAAVQTVQIPPSDEVDDRPIEALPLPLPPPPPTSPMLAEGTGATRMTPPSIVLPANPFAGATDASLEGLVDGGLHEVRPVPPPVAAPSKAPRPRKRRLAWLASAMIAAAAAGAAWTASAGPDVVPVEPSLVEVEPIAPPPIVEMARVSAPAPMRKQAPARVVPAPRVAKKSDIERPPI